MSVMLYVVATPIGNLEDITLRAINILKEVELIAAEDTRRTMGLLEHYGIRKPVVSYYEHNKLARGKELLEKLRDGLDIALVSDAGTPGISDPGADLIRDCIAQGLEVTMVPGACAGIMALVLSGMDTTRFVFEGFIGRDKQDAAEFCERVRSQTCTVIIYEAPHRLLKTLKMLAPVLQERQVAVCRELTKKFEEIRRGTASEHVEYYSQNEPRGEFILILQGLQGRGKSKSAKSAKSAMSAAGDAEADCDGEESKSITNEELRGVIEKFTAGGMKLNEAMKAAAEYFGISRNQAYNIYLGK